jgi:hypothetical protein
VPHSRGFSFYLGITVAGFAALMALAHFLGQIYPNRQTETVSPIKSSDPRVCLQFVSKDQGDGDENSIKITGSLKNNCGRNFRYIQIRYKLFDRSGAVVGTAFTNLASLANGEIWKFQAHAFVHATNFRLDDIAAY